MLEKIGTEEYLAVSEACVDMLEWLKILKSNNRNIAVAEIGVEIGATTVEILKLLDKGDKLYIFDFEHKVSKLKEELEHINKNHVEIIAMGNSSLLYDSYNWPLAKMTMNMLEKHEDGVLDLTYIDGAHTFIMDSTCANLVKKLCKPNGVVIFDDYYWLYPEEYNYWNRDKEAGLELYTKEQLSTPAIEMVCKIFMDTDLEFERLSGYSKPRAIYKRLEFDAIQDVKRMYDMRIAKSQEDLQVVQSRYNLLVKMSQLDLEAINNIKKNSIVIYGAGNVGKFFYEKFSEVLDVKAFIDKYAPIGEYKGIPVGRLEILDNIECDMLLVTAVYDLEIIEREIREKNEKVNIMSLEKWLNSF